MRRLSVLLFGLCLAAIGLAGCGVANLGKYYTPETTEHFPRTDFAAVVDGGQDAEAVYQRMYSSGYLRIGRVSFVGQWEDDSFLMDFGKTLGADVVLVGRRYQNSRVVDTDRGGDLSYGTSSGTDTYGNNEAMFDPSLRPGVHESAGRDSYVVRDYRQVAIFLRRIAG